MAKIDETVINNSGFNQGVLVANNSGNINITYNKTKITPSLIARIVKVIANVCCDENYNSDSSDDLLVYKPDEKLEYNKVIKYKYIFEELSTYYSHCHSILNEYDDFNLDSKSKILKCIHLWYLEEKGNLLLSLKNNNDRTDIEKILDNADLLIDKIKARILEAVKNNNDIDAFCLEDMELGTTCFVCYCFIECKILEKPI